MARAEWIAVDWGTTRLRAWAMSGREVLAEASSDRGMNTLDPEAYEPALVDLVGPWLAADRRTAVLCCGMVGARQGWVEAPYRAVPCPPLSGAPVRAPTTDARLSVHVLPGLRQDSPHDVMRGEETQIAGFLNLNAGWDGVLCLPGTHTKWVQVSAGEVVSFQTFMTGELFALLSERSVLRHSVQGSGRDEDAFAAAVSETLSTPETLAARLFRLRADHLLADTGPDTLRAQLSGLLIGAELAAARHYWLGQQLAVIGADEMAAAYVAALSQQGAPAIHARATAMTLAGLTAAHRLLESDA
jgi:2-dehydro-3-deoxygalactonokinase